MIYRTVLPIVSLHCNDWMQAFFLVRDVVPIANGLPLFLLLRTFV